MNTTKELVGDKGFSCMPPALGCECYEEIGPMMKSGKDHLAKTLPGKAQIQFSTYTGGNPEISGNRCRYQIQDA